MYSLYFLISLAKLTLNDYALYVPEKKGNEVRSSKVNTKAHKPRNAVFLRVYVIASFLWAAMAGRLLPTGFLCVQSSNPVICCPPCLEAGGSLTTTQRNLS